MVILKAWLPTENGTPPCTVVHSDAPMFYVLVCYFFSVDLRLWRARNFVRPAGVSLSYASSAF